jgi:hypothetical protein
VIRNGYAKYLPFPWSLNVLNLKLAIFCQIISVFQELVLEKGIEQLVGSLTL